MFFFKTARRSWSKGTEDIRTGASQIKTAFASPAEKREVAVKRRDTHQQQADRHRRRAHGWGGKKEEMLANRSDQLAMEAQREIDRLDTAAGRQDAAEAGDLPEDSPEMRLRRLDEAAARGEVKKREHVRRTWELLGEIDRESRRGE